MSNPNLKDMIRGWFIGNFEPSVHFTKDFEVAIQNYQSGDYEKKHMHKVATEITVILDGEAEMLGKVYKNGDIVVVEPGQATSFRALSDLKTVVVKFPSAKNDKYILED